MTRSRCIKVGQVAETTILVHWGSPFVLAVGTLVLAVYVLPGLEPGWGGPTYWAAGALIALAEHAAGVLHEVGHALVATASGQRVRSITLYGLGAATQRTGGRQTARDRLLIALAGPASHFLLAGLLAALRQLPAIGHGPAYHVLTLLVLTNLCVGLLNLLPISPLDGWRAAGALALAARRKASAT